MSTVDPEITDLYPEDNMINEGLNIFLLFKFSVNFEISLSLKFFINLVFYFLKCVNLVILTKFC